MIPGVGPCLAAGGILGRFSLMEFSDQAFVIEFWHEVRPARHFCRLIPGADVSQKIDAGSGEAFFNFRPETDRGAHFMQRGQRQAMVAVEAPQRGLA